MMKGVDYVLLDRLRVVMRWTTANIKIKYYEVVFY